jgi:uncharacterized SAM-binding protein YcdF (DUF218 family)
MNRPFDCISNFIFIDNPPEKADIIFIPGGSHPQLMGRAAELYHQGFAPYILPSGGYNPKIAEYSSEWEFLKKLASLLDVPDQAILKENQALNTHENADFSRKVLLEMELPIHKAIIVCKAYHARRALLTYQAVFPLSTSFLVSSVTDNRGITKENWFTKKEFIAMIMGEVSKIGTYCEDFIPEWVRPGDDPVIQSNAKS